MVLSQNGWTALTSGTSPLLVGLSWVTGKVRAGSVHVILNYLARRFDAEVERIDKASSWGYAYRAVRAAVDLSNHSSGTAVDFNAPRHPLGRVGTFSAAQVAAIHRILADLEHLVRWGGDYPGRKDEMHFEVIGTPAQVDKLAARILAGNVTTSDQTNTTHTPAPVPAPTPALPAPLTPVEDTPMQRQVISNPATNTFAVVGPLGSRVRYYLPNPDQLAVAVELYGDPVEFDTREAFDLAFEFPVIGMV